MCLGLPGRIVSVEAAGGDGGIDGASRMGNVEVAGVVRRIDLTLLRGPVLPGEHVLIHSGIALERMPADQAREAMWLETISPEAMSLEAMSLFASPGALGKDVAQDEGPPG
jgi:hydrogenase expression/formation protein HypC